MYDKKKIIADNEAPIDCGVRKLWRAVGAMSAILFVALNVRTAAAQLTNIPFAGAVAGLSPGTGAAVCSTALDTVGDGCPATQASLNGPQSLTVDSLGNIYIADFGNHSVRVVYKTGAALAAVIAVVNPTLVGSPKAGYVYLVGGSQSASQGGACAGSPEDTGTVTGDGCPAYDADSRPYGVSVDSAGDIFYYDHALSNRDEVRVVYAGGAAAANLLKLEVGVSAPKIGYVYRIGGASTPGSGYAGDGALASSGAFNLARNLVVDTNENIFVADTGNNIIRRIDGKTGILTTFAGGGTGCKSGTAASCTASFTGDNGPATSATLSGPTNVFEDGNGNLYIADTGNKRVRAVYAGGTLPGISNPIIGDIYTVAGGGTSTANGTAALSLSLAVPNGVSMDVAGNLYITDGGNKLVWRIDAKTQIATLVAGGGTAHTVGSYCSGTAGPKATDTVGDGCPATLGTLSGPSGSPFSFAPDGVAYLADTSGQLVRSFSFAGPIADTDVSSSSKFSLAYGAVNSNFVTPTLTLTTQGSPANEFSATSDNCTAGATQAVNAVCSYTVTFAPTLPGRRVANIQAASTSISAPLNIGLDGKGIAPLLLVSPEPSTSVVSSIAAPTSITANSVGGVYVSDSSTGTVSGEASGGTFSTLASGLSNPGQLAVDGAGNLYIADAGNNRIVEVTTAGVSSSVITGLSAPSGAVSTGSGVVYVADTGNNRVLQYDNGMTSTVPLSGLSGPTALALDADGILYIADTGNGRIVSFNPATHVQTIISVSAAIQPVGLAVDAAGDIYFANAASGGVYMVPNGSISPIALVTGLTKPGGLSLDPSGNLFFTDISSGSVQELPQQMASLSFGKINMGEQSAEQNLTLINVGNEALTFTLANTYSGSGDAADFVVKQGTPACGSGPIAIGGSCVLNALFSPVGVGAYSDVLTFPSNAVNSGVVKATLTGMGENLVKTSLAVTLTSPASGNVVYGQNAIFTATITSATTTTTPSGSLAIQIDGTTTQTVSVSGAATQFTATFAPGTHVITATYGGDTVYASSFNSYSLTATVQPTTTTLSYSATLQTTSPSLTFAANVSGTLSGTPTGTVAFYNGTTLLGTSTLSALGTATYTTGTVVYPAYGFRAVYSGDVDYATSSSPTLTPTTDFGITASPTTISAAAGVAVSSALTITPYFGESGTVTFSCSGMPANSACRFSPQTADLSSGTAQTVSLQFFTNIASSLTSQNRAGRSAILMCFAVPFLLLGSRKLRRRRGTYAIWSALLILACIGGLGSLIGCSEGNGYVAGQTPAGTSTVTLTAKDATGNSHSITFSLTVHTQ